MKAIFIFFISISQYIPNILSFCTHLHLVSVCAPRESNNTKTVSTWPEIQTHTKTLIVSPIPLSGLNPIGSCTNSCDDWSKCGFVWRIEVCVPSTGRFKAAAACSILHLLISLDPLTFCVLFGCVLFSYFVTVVCVALSLSRLLRVVGRGAPAEVVVEVGLHIMHTISKHTICITTLG